MANYFKRYERKAFIILAFITILTVLKGIYIIIQGEPNVAKWIGTSGLLATVTGVVQLEISGLFEKIITHYTDEEKYPYGPTSYITREIIDNPDQPILSWLKYTCFFELRTGFWLIVIGTFLQIWAVWL